VQSDAAATGRAQKAIYVCHWPELDRHSWASVLCATQTANRRQLFWSQAHHTHLPHCSASPIHP